ncbi:MAG: hypothetical protein V4650_00165 [Pseudomonadota bacterium]
MAAEDSYVYVALRIIGKGTRDPRRLFGLSTQEVHDLISAEKRDRIRGDKFSLPGLLPFEAVLGNLRDLGVLRATNVDGVTRWALDVVTLPDDPSDGADGLPDQSSGGGRDSEPPGTDGGEGDDSFDGDGLAEVLLQPILLCVTDEAFDELLDRQLARDNE